MTYSKELLGSWNDVSDYDGGTQRIYDVLVVWMEDKTVLNLAYGTLEN